MMAQRKDMMRIIRQDAGFFGETRVWWNRGCWCGR